MTLDEFKKKFLDIESISFDVSYGTVVFIEDEIIDIDFEPNFFTDNYRIFDEVRINWIFDLTVKDSERARKFKKWLENHRPWYAMITNKNNEKANDMYLGRINLKIEEVDWECQKKLSGQFLDW